MIDHSDIQQLIPEFFHAVLGVILCSTHVVTSRSETLIFSIAASLRAI
jgi:hypothetical protein